jgi:tyrocidine synthetase III
MNAGRYPLFDVVFALHETAGTKLPVEGLTAESSGIASTTSKYDLSLQAFRSATSLSFMFEYASDLFSPLTIEKYESCFLRLLIAIVNKPSARLSDISVLEDAEALEQLTRFSKIKPDYPEMTVIEKFQEQAAQYPDRISLVQDEIHISYNELNLRATKLACHLKGKGIVEEAVVGIMADRTIESVTGILSILLAGAIYLPLDPAYPAERINFMISDASIQYILKTKQEKISHAGVVCIDMDDDEIYRGDPGGILPVLRTDSNAYIIYTSGTTGIPKGTLVTNRNLIRLFINSAFPFSFSQNDTWCLFHSLSFDFSVWEMLGALLYGGRLVIVAKSVARQASLFLQLLKRHQVTVLNQTPSAFYSLSQEEMALNSTQATLRYIIFGGEMLRFSRIRNWQNKYPQTRFINMFGITETTIHVTVKPIGENDIQSNKSGIGIPLPGNNLYILGHDMNLLAPGITGELYVGGDGVAGGYLNRPELTHEKFIRSPFNPGERLYRSGDLGRITSDKTFEYLGRRDGQLKIRGYRIEPREIENYLLLHPMVREAVVLPYSSNESVMLCAYYATQTFISGKELAEFLEQHLPAHMIPARFIRFDSLPLTINGKIDVKSLPDPRAEVLADHLPARTPLEFELVAAVAGKLGLHERVIGRNTNFIELGLNSLSLAVLLSEIQKKYDAVISLMDIFKHPDIEHLAMLIEESGYITEQDSSSIDNTEIFV